MLHFGRLVGPYMSIQWDSSVALDIQQCPREATDSSMRNRLVDRQHTDTSTSHRLLREVFTTNFSVYIHPYIYMTYMLFQVRNTTNTDTLVREKRLRADDLALPPSPKESQDRYDDKRRKNDQPDYPPPTSFEVYSGYRDDMTKKRETTRQKKDSTRAQSQMTPYNSSRHSGPSIMLTRRWADERAEALPIPPPLRRMSGSQLTAHRRRRTLPACPRSKDGIQPPRNIEIRERAVDIASTAPTEEAS